MTNCSHQYREGENFCRKCGENRKTESFSKKSDVDSKFTGSVIIGQRGYFIAITDGEVTHQLKQKEVKRYEEQFKLTGQELADFLAKKCTKVSYKHNGKYGNSSASFEFRNENQKTEDAIKNAKREKIENKKQTSEKQASEKNLKKVETKEKTFKILIKTTKPKTKWGMGAVELLIDGVGYLDFMREIQIKYQGEYGSVNHLTKKFLIKTPTMVNTFINNNKRELCNCHGDGEVFITLSASIDEDWNDFISRTQNELKNLLK